MTHETVVYAFSWVFPWLAATWALGFVPVRGKSRLLLPAIAAAIVVFPIHGMPVGRWLYGFNANFSLPFTIWVALAALQRLTGRAAMTPAEGRGAAIFGALSGLALYPMSVGLTKCDPYALGWHPTAMLAGTVVLIGGLLIGRNRFAVWLVVAIAAYDLRLLESPNYWDYLVDPLYTLVSVAALVAGRRTITQ